jgi:hypothetical protein
MLRDPKQSKTIVEKTKDQTTGRFQIRKLEDRIAPVPGGHGCHFNPQGKLVGKCAAPGQIK